MANYIETLGACEYDNLIAGNTIPTHTVTGTIASGQGKLARGTVLALSTGTSGTNKLVILGTTAGGNETLTAYGILCDEVDATSADAVGEIYVTGQFNTNQLIVKEEEEEDISGCPFCTSTPSALCEIFAASACISSRTLAAAM